MAKQPLGAVTLLCVSLAACGGSQGDPRLLGAGLEVSATSGAYAQAPDFHARTGRVLAMSAEHWGFNSGFAGLQIVFQSEPVDCSGTPHLGCYVHALDGSLTITVATNESNCVERSPLPHEILHYVLDMTTGDPDGGHRDWRWADLDASLYPSLADGTKLICYTP